MRGVFGRGLGTGATGRAPAGGHDTIIGPGQVSPGRFRNTSCMINFSPILPNLLVGTCPASVVDARRLAQAGVTAVMNLQTERDFQRLGIDWNTLEMHYHELGIAVYRVPMIDFDEADIERLLPQAVSSLNDALTAGHRVYLHCTAGQERSPTTAVAWLAWYGDDSIDSALARVRAVRKPVNPYEQILRRLPTPESGAATSSGGG